jgi:hypothetical protein
VVLSHQVPKLDSVPSNEFRMAVKSAKTLLTFFIAAEYSLVSYCRVSLKDAILSSIKDAI